MACTTERRSETAGPPPDPVNPAPFSWGKDWKKPEGEFPCEVCGKFNPWADAAALGEPFSPFRMCHDCLQHEPPYGSCLIEVPEQVIELDRKHIPLRREDRESGPGAKPRWFVQGRKLIVEAHEIGFYFNAGSW